MGFELSVRQIVGVARRPRPFGHTTPISNVWEEPEDVISKPLQRRWVQIGMVHWRCRTFLKSVKVNDWLFDIILMRFLLFVFHGFSTHGWWITQHISRHLEMSGRERRAKPSVALENTSRIYRTITKLFVPWYWSISHIHIWLCPGLWPPSHTHI